MALYETEVFLGRGSGGLSAFRVYNDNSDKNNKFPDAYNTLIITGKKKVTYKFNI